jgi:PAS domain S-box-containing protein
LKFNWGEPKDSYKTFLILTLVALACVLTYYFHFVLGTGIIFTHFYYIPIILSAIWWKRKGIWVALFLASILILTDWINPLKSDPLTEDFFRVIIFISVSLITIILSEIVEKSKNKLAESEEKYRIISQNTGDVIWVLDPNSLRITYVSPSVYNLSGYTPKEVLNQSLEEIITPKSFQSVIEKIPKTIQSINSGDDSVRVQTNRVYQVHKDGRIIPTEVVTSFMGDKDRPVSQIIGVSRDITERLKNEEKIQNLANIVESSEDSIISKSLDGRITGWNKGAKLIYGYSADEVIGKDVSILAPPELKNETKELIKKIKKGEHVKHYESIRIGKNGKEIYVSLTLSPIFDTSGKLIGISTISRDITEQKMISLGLHREQTIDQALEKIYSPLISPGKPLQDISMVISNEALALTGSEHGFVSTIDPQNHDLINHTLTRMMSECEVYEEGKSPEEIRFPINPDGQYPSLWGHCLNTKKAFYTNEAKKHPSSKGTPKGHMPIEKYLAVPVLIGNDLVGEIALANPSNKDYNDEDIDSIKRIADFFALAIQRKRYEDLISKSLGEKEILLKEIHHRVKNNLMIISSLLNLQSRYLKDEESREIFKESQNRAKSMALIHQRLYESTDLKNIGFKEYITTLANDLYRNYVKDPSCVSLKLEIEDLNIDINIAIPLGLILNELITNSMKYAFPDEEKGTITVAFNKKKDNFVLIVSDDGEGFPENLDYENTESLGMQLVTSLTKQISGELELDRTNGTTFKITFTEIKIS